MTFYQNISAHYEHIFPFNSAHLGFITSHLPIKTFPKVLEIGSATGLLTNACQQYGYQIQGLELDESMVAIAKQDYPDIPFIGENMLNIALRFASESQDGVVCFGNTLVHLDSLELMQSFLDSTYKVLKPGGKLLIQFINYDRIIDQHTTSLPPIDNDIISFDRSYELLSPTEISFTGCLTIKNNGKSSSSAQVLYPLRKASFEAMAHKTGFSTQAFGTFKSDDWSENTLQTIVVCVKD